MDVNLKVKMGDAAQLHMNFALDKATVQLTKVFADVEDYLISKQSYIQVKVNEPFDDMFERICGDVAEYLAERRNRWHKIQKNWLRKKTVVSPLIFEEGYIIKTWTTGLTKKKFFTRKSLE